MNANPLDVCDTQSRVEAFWRPYVVTPIRTDDVNGRRLTDASVLAFPLQLVIIIVVGVATTVGSVWAFTSSIKADLRVVLQKIEDKDEFWQREQAVLQKQVDANERKLELLRLEYQQFREQTLTTLTKGQR